LLAACELAEGAFVALNEANADSYKYELQQIRAAIAKATP